jgi:hypothetical protein
MRIQTAPRETQHESYWLVQGEANLIGSLPVWRAFFSCSSDIMEAPSVALCAFKMSWKLLNAHSEYSGSCSILPYRRLEQHNRPS